MGRCKEIVVKVIPAKVATPFVKAHHYSGKVVNNSQLHFGAFLDGKLHGVMSFGPSMDKRKVIHLVEGTGFNEFIELNRMAFDDYLPRNAESYCIGYALRQIKKQAPHIKWVISFADGTQCGDGTIYRASNFVLTGIKPNGTILQFPKGERIAYLTLSAHPASPQVKKIFSNNGIPNGFKTKKTLVEDYGVKQLKGYMLRYIYFLDKRCKEKLTVPIIPFSKIDEMGAGMYKGQNITQQERHVECDAQKERAKDG